MPESRFLEIYLRDQLALGMAWRELAARAARNNRRTPAGLALVEVRQDIAEDVETFEGIMRALGVAPSTSKNLLALLGERAARLKLNGRVVRYSPLSRFEELDALIIGIGGKLTLWKTLRDGAGLGPRLPGVNFETLINRARAQRSMLKPHHLQAAREALATLDPVSRIPLEDRPSDAASTGGEADALIDEASEGSFPASDPPPYWARGASVAPQRPRPRPPADP
jgi:hypothetical protein